MRRDYEGNLGWTTDRKHGVKKMPGRRFPVATVVHGERGKLAWRFGSGLGFIYLPLQFG